MGSAKHLILSDGTVYPCTINSDRYGGGYSGGEWVAWAIDAEDVPAGPEGCDTSAEMFWGRPGTWNPAGIGNTPNEALANLREKLQQDD